MSVAVDVSHSPDDVETVGRNDQPRQARQDRLNKGKASFAPPLPRRSQRQPVSMLQLSLKPSGSRN
jgi:hypothetical protein